MALNCRQTFFVKLLGGDHFVFVGTGEIEVVFAIDLAAKTYLENAAIQQEAFFKGPTERRAVRILAAEILIPHIVVSVELNERNGAMLFYDGSEDRQADGVIASDANAADTGCEERSNSLLD